MSSPIRPVKLEPVPQSRGSEPAIASSSEAPLFGAILDFHLEEEGEETEESSKAEEPEAAPWTLLGVAPVPVSLVEPELEITAPVRALTGAAIEVCTLDKPQLCEVGREEAPGLNSVIQKLRPDTERQQISSPHPGEPEEIAGLSAESGLKSSGIAVAKETGMLLHAENYDLEGSTEQPESAVAFDLPEMNLPFYNEGSLKPGSLRLLPLAVEPVEKTLVQYEAVAPAFRTEVQNSRLQTDQVADVSPKLVVESIQEHITVLRSSGQNELKVVLRPDASTELFLEIRHVDGQIHVLARCQRGDFVWLDSQWAGIQMALSQQGIRVEALQATSPAEEGETGTTHDDKGFHREQSEGRADHSAEQEFPKLGRPIRRTGSNTGLRGWQTWA